MTQATLAKYVAPIGVILLASLGANAYQIVKYSSLNNELVLERDRFASTTLEYSNDIKNLKQNLNQAQAEKNNLESDLQNERDRNNQFANQIGDITNKVVVLDKLSKTDPELLQKYSKIFFLNENYIPAELTNIDSEYLYDQSKVKQIHTKVWPYLKNLLMVTKQNGIDIKIASAYRSFGEQTSLKAGYTFTYGAGTANQFSADQGYSEHQLGTTVDFTTPALRGALDDFGQTEAYKWLVAHASEYGFTLSYPEGNSYYEFEPWHWRFVGVTLAKKLQHDNNHFYDLPQRVLDTHLVNLFEN